MINAKTKQKSLFVTVQKAQTFLRAARRKERRLANLNTSLSISLHSFSVDDSDLDFSIGTSPFHEQSNQCNLLCDNTNDLNINAVDSPSNNSQQPQPEYDDQRQSLVTKADQPNLDESDSTHSSPLAPRAKTYSSFLCFNQCTDYGSFEQEDKHTWDSPTRNNYDNDSKIETKSLPSHPTFEERIEVELRNVAALKITPNAATTEDILQNRCKSDIQEDSLKPPACSGKSVDTHPTICEMGDRYSMIQETSPYTPQKEYFKITRF